MSSAAPRALQPGRSRRFEAGVLAVYLLLFGYVAVTSSSFPTAARLFPQAVSYVGLVLTCLALWRAVRPAADRVRQTSLFTGDLPADADEGEAAHPLPYLLWTIGYFLIIAVAGFFPGTAMFVFAFLRTRPEVGTLAALLWTSGVLAMAYGMGLLLQLRWPGGLLMRLLGS